MSKINRSITKKIHRKKIIKMAKQYRSRSKNCFRIAIQKIEKGLQYMYKNRRIKKRDFRSLWIQRINAEVRKHNIKYSSFISFIKNFNIHINRKIMSNIIIKSPQIFNTFIIKIKQI